MSEKRIIRDDDYYGGSLYIENFPTKPYESSFDLRIVWEAYQGGSVVVSLQDVREMMALGQLLLKAAEVAEPNKELRERSPS